MTIKKANKEMQKAKNIMDDIIIDIKGAMKFWNVDSKIYGDYEKQVFELKAAVKVIEDIIIKNNNLLNR